MFYKKQRLIHLFSASFCCLVSIALLTGCRWSGDNQTSTPTPSPTLVPTATSTPSPTPTPIAQLTTYQGNGYTIDYPKDWKVSVGKDGFVSFSDPQGVTYVSIASQPNPQGVVSTTDLVNAGLQVFQSQAKNYQRLDATPTTTLAGEIWSQGAATGDISPDSQTATVTVKVVVIADNHPAQSPQTRSFVVAYGTDERVFHLIDVSYFQPMLKSFKFTENK
jgi:hypothetical protein